MFALRSIAVDEGRAVDAGNTEFGLGVKSTGRVWKPWLRCSRWSEDQVNFSCRRTSHVCAPLYGSTTIRVSPMVNGFWPSTTCQLNSATCCGKISDLAPGMKRSARGTHIATARGEFLRNRVGKCPGNLLESLKRDVQVDLGLGSAAQRPLCMAASVHHTTATGCATKCKMYL